LVLRSLKRPEEALQAHDRALQLQPDFAQAWANRGNVLRDLGRSADAVQSYAQAIAYQPAFPSALHGLGLAQGDLGRWEEALGSFDKAIAQKPAFAVAYLDRGNALRELDRLDDALESYGLALRHDPGYAQAWSNRGVVLKHQGRMTEALQSYRKALELKPNFVDAMVNCSTLLKEMLRLDESMAMNQNALALDPASSGAHLNLAICQLLSGDLPTGFSHFEWRWKTDQLRDNLRPFTQPLWLGQELPTGSTVLLHAEQGLGDTLQFCRYARLVADCGLRVVLEVQPPLVEILRTVEGVSAVVARGEPLPAFDAQCPLMSLPLALKTALNTIPARDGYLHADTHKLNLWQQRLGEHSRTRVGLVWSGRPEHKNDHNRSMALADFAGALDTRFEYHCLQKEIRAADLVTLESRGGIAVWRDALESFADTAALVECMDLVVAVDTSVAHLAAALGKPVWLLLPFSPDWRWLLERDDTPWYPSMRLFRQTATGDWSDVLSRVREALAALPTERVRAVGT
jgi:tetratricopeptide (TPR) repeat protein